MRDDHGHISDRELLLAADAEISAARMDEVRAHLAVCDGCRARMAKFEQTSADFAAAYRNSSGHELPDAEAARTAFLQRLAESPEKSHSAARFYDFAGALRAPRWVYNSALALAVVLLIALAYRQSWLPNSGATIARVEAAPLPEPNLTPGAAQTIPADICLVTPREDASAIPVAERKEVFREYGIDYRRAGQYELDHLITPALGGTDDIHNLWPEPYNSTEWNAHVKDQIEDLLHQMVCSGQVDLPTAQREIATNWIDAYKHYFHTDKPLLSGGQEPGIPAKS